MPENQFKGVFEANYTAILRHLTLLTGEPAVAEDLTQEAFLKLYQQAPAELVNPRAWLFRVASNLGYNYLRRANNRSKQEVPYVGQSNTAVHIDDLVATNQERLAVREVLTELSWRDRTCLLMKFSGYSYAEIAQALGVKKSSVGTILVRAQERFRREFERKGGS